MTSWLKIFIFRIAFAYLFATNRHLAFYLDFLRTGLLFFDIPFLNVVVLLTQVLCFSSLSCKVGVRHLSKEAHALFLN